MRPRVGVPVTIGGRVMLVCGGFGGDAVAGGGTGVWITRDDVMAGGVGVQGACVVVGGLTLDMDGAVVGGAVVGGVVGTTAPVGLTGCLDTSRAADITVAIVATTSTPTAVPASAVPYHGPRDCSCISGEML